MAEALNLLLAEDDTISRRFLRDALTSLGHRVDAVAAGDAALAAARQRSFDALLLDLNLPMLQGDAVLRAVRADPQAASTHSAALLLTADTTLTDMDGFAAVVHKPVTIARLQQALTAIRCGDAVGAGASRRADGPAPVWDDAVALAAANGNADIVGALRPLLLAELPVQRARIRAAWVAGDAAAARADLHRLRAACGFCGAMQLAAAIDAVMASTDAAARAAFEQACERVLQPLPVAAPG